MIKILLCDDDIRILKRVTKLISKIQSNYKIGFEIDMKNNGNFVFSNDAVYDIAIVDIEMPGISGLELTEKLKAENPDVVVIILTSYADYLDNAMKIQVFRYLSKPIDEDRFNRNFIEAIEYCKQMSKQIVVEKFDEVCSIRTKDILYIENKKHGSIIATRYSMYETNKKPSYWYKLIDQPNCFIESHKSYIVNLQNVVNFDKSAITFRVRGNICRQVHCVSQRRYSAFKKAFYNFAGGLQ